jgi:fructuronate reductase
VAGWLRFVLRQAQSGVALVDPLDAALSQIGRAASGNTASDVDAFLTLDSVFAPLSADARFVDALRGTYAGLGDAGPEAVARALTAVDADA